ncbi:MAG: murein L,D-transpeptidase catalytic domain family protein [Sphingobacteriaceae bacterium]
MNKILIIALWAIASSTMTGEVGKNRQANIPEDVKKSTVKTVKASPDPVREIYQEMELDGVLKWEAFEQALQGYKSLKPEKRDIITVIDFTLPSTEKRMYVLDLKAKKMLFHNIVSHGRNSGEKYAKSFSNKHGSFQSSLGFYYAQETYMGGNGYSLRLDGLEKGINDQARPRAIVVHGAAYASQDIIQSTGRLGRSYGCPALPRELTKPIINTIKDGTLMFIYAGNEDYLANTTLIKDTSANDEILIAEQQQEETNQTATVVN